MASSLGLKIFINYNNPLTNLKIGMYLHIYTENIGLHLNVLRHITVFWHIQFHDITIPLL